MINNIPTEKYRQAQEMTRNRAQKSKITLNALDQPYLKAKVDLLKIHSVGSSGKSCAYKQLRDI